MPIAKDAPFPLCYKTTPSSSSLVCINTHSFHLSHCFNISDYCFFFFIHHIHILAQGRGNANVIIISALLLVVLMVQREMVNAATTYTVGGASGWGFNVAGWTKGKRFRTGDVLVFKYNKAIHNVLRVDERSYNGCKAPRGTKVFQSGNDQIRLGKGKSFFICNFVGHCQAGMKITVNAA